VANLYKIDVVLASKKISHKVLLSGEDQAIDADAAVPGKSQQCIAEGRNAFKILNASELLHLGDRVAKRGLNPRQKPRQAGK
jgi:hypothetical protein